jgi:PAS domain S-box-containing protein
MLASFQVSDSVFIPHEWRCRVRGMGHEEIQRLNDRLQHENGMLCEQVDPASDPAVEIKHLRHFMDDLARILALPDAWRGREPAEVLSTLADSLMEMLTLDFFYVRVIVETDEKPLEILRASPAHSKDEIAESLDDWLKEDRPSQTRRRVGDEELSIFPLRMGVLDGVGSMVAGSRRAGFPEKTERQLLSVAANQAAAALQQALFLGKQKRMARELDRWVAERVVERTRAEEDLRASETNLREILDSIPGLVGTWSPSGEGETLSRQFAEYFGRPAEEVKNWAANDVVHPDDLQRVIATFSASLATGTPLDDEHRYLRADGVYRWFHVRAVPARDKNGQITRWYALSTDVDDLRRAEKSLRASEQKLSLIINTIPTTAWSTRPDGYCDFLSDRWLKYAGITFEQALGWGWAASIHPDDAEGLREYWVSCLASGTPVDTEARIRRFDGVYRWFLFRANPLRDESGNIVKWYGTNVDIEDRKRAENALRANERDLIQIINTIPMLAWSTRPDGYVEFLNQRWLDFTGLSAEQAGGFGWSVAVHPDDVHGLVEYWQSALASGTGVDVEARLRRFDGEYRWFLFRADPLRDESGAIVKWYGTNTDLHDWKQAQEELRSTQAELARVTRAMTIGQLTASIAHEVSQPLSGVIVNASTGLRMLKSDPPNIDGAREAVRRTIRDGNRTSEVITRLRTLFSKKQIEVELFDLNEAVREVIALLSGELQRNNVILNQEFSDRLPAVEGDRVQVQQVILNLIRNGSDAMDQVNDRPRQLIIRTESDGNEATVSIQDSGVGFSPEISGRLFESFFTTKQEGMGIGLSVSRSIVEAHHGRLWAVQNVGPGATFAFSIPQWVGRLPVHAE